jgi:hypothetical protein
MPEVSFIHGLMGFQRYAGQAPSASASAPMQAAIDAFTSYVKRAPTEAETDPTAGALLLSAVLEFNRGRAGPRPMSPMPSASQHADEAYRLAPYNSDARNLAAVFRLAASYSAAGAAVRVRDTESDLIAASALDPTNALPLANLQSLYELVSLPQVAAKLDTTATIPPGEIQSQLARVKAIRERMRTAAIAGPP